MNEHALAQQIAAQVLRDTQFWIAVVGLVGAVVGSLLTIAGNLLVHWVQERKQKKLDSQRINLLMQMLERDDWRHLSTMSRVIGAPLEETRRLLIQLGARASESERADGEEAWALLSKKPLSQVKL
jgi:hypothetical protein